MSLAGPVCVMLTVRSEGMQSAYYPPSFFLGGVQMTGDGLDVVGDEPTPGNSERRFVETLQRLLTISSPELRPTLDQASSLVAEALGADKVDIFLYETDKDSLVALGTSDTHTG